MNGLSGASMMIKKNSAGEKRCTVLFLCRKV